MIEVEEIEQLILAAMPQARVHVTDLTGTRDHYSVTVVAPEFEGTLPIKQHRMVNAALAAPLKSGALHALQLTTLTPAEYDAQS